MRTLLGLAAAVFLFGCTQFVPYKPAKARFTAEPSTVYKSALRTLVEEGLTIETKDVDAGVIVTAWQVDGEYRYRWRVVIRDTSIKVVSGCHFHTPKAQVLGPNKMVWEKCPGDNQPEGRTEEGRKLAKLIVSEAQEASADKPPKTAQPPVTVPAEKQPEPEKQPEKQPENLP